MFDGEVVLIPHIRLFSLVIMKNFIKRIRTISDRLKDYRPLDNFFPCLMNYFEYGSRFDLTA